MHAIAKCLLDSLKLQFQAVVSCSMDVGTELGPLEQQQVHLAMEPSLLTHTPISLISGLSQLDTSLHYSLHAPTSTDRYSVEATSWPEITHALARAGAKGSKVKRRHCHQPQAWRMASCKREKIPLLGYIMY